jgi:hypothetical protein
MKARNLPNLSKSDGLDHLDPELELIIHLRRCLAEVLLRTVRDDHSLD